VLENNGSLLTLELTFVICFMKCRIMQGHLEKGFAFSLGLELEKASAFLTEDKMKGLYLGGGTSEVID
jgi:hypothetical protein